MAACPVLPLPLCTAPWGQTLGKGLASPTMPVIRTAIGIINNQAQSCWPQAGSQAQEIQQPPAFSADASCPAGPSRAWPPPAPPAAFSAQGEPRPITQAAGRGLGASTSRPVSQLMFSRAAPLPGTALPGGEGSGMGPYPRGRRLNPLASHTGFASLALPHAGQYPVLCAQAPLGSAPAEPTKGGQLWQGPESGLGAHAPCPTPADSPSSGPGPAVHSQETRSVFCRKCFWPRTDTESGLPCSGQGLWCGRGPSTCHCRLLPRPGVLGEYAPAPGSSQLCGPPLEGDPCAQGPLSIPATHRTPLA